MPTRVRIQTLACPSPIRCTIASSSCNNDRNSKVWNAQFCTTAVQLAWPTVTREIFQQQTELFRGTEPCRKSFVPDPRSLSFGQY